MEKKLDNIIEKMLNRAEGLGWKVAYEEDYNYFEFMCYSPAGAEYSFGIYTNNNPETFVQEILKTHIEFDVSTEAYCRLDSNGHGIKGLPFAMDKVYAEMVACEEMIFLLYNTLKEYVA